MINIVKHPETDAIFTPVMKDGDTETNLLKVQLREEGRVSVGANGIIDLISPVSFTTVTKKIAESDAFKNLKDGDVWPIPGKIVRKISREPQYADHEPVLNTYVDPPVPALRDGKPYYAQTEFTTDMTRNHEEIVGVWNAETEANSGVKQDAKVGTSLI